MKTKYVCPISLGILIIFHCVGMFLFLTDPHASDLAWLNILLCTVLLFINSKTLKQEFLFLILVFIGGFTIECLGVNTGYLFGDYTYETALGYKWFQTPLIIGLNWYSIVVIAVAVARLFTEKLWVLTLFAAILGVGMDFLIEPVAISFDFWTWNSGIIPLFNYVSWFIFLVLFILLYLKIQKSKNVLGIPLFIIWAIFFIMLNFV